MDDRLLTTREQIDAFKAEHGVATTPQTFIDGRRIGGYDDIRRYLGERVGAANSKTYKPVIAVFTMTAMMALAASYAAFGSFLTEQALSWFVAFSMCALALLKFQNIETFSNSFIGYDLLGTKWIGYSYVYPFAEAAAGVLMAAGALSWVSIPVMLFIGTIGAVSVFKAVYVDKRDLKCACVGGGANVPLGFISLTENLIMVGAALWMLVERL